jgi:deoxyribonuclease-4
VPAPDELGAHVSAAGGVERAPARAAELRSRVLQLFTKQPGRWAAPVISSEAAAAFRAARAQHGITTAAAHGAYLINLASPDPVLRERSYESFRGELERAALLGLEYLVAHPGSARGSERAAARARNAESLRRALESVPGDVVVLLETNAGAGSCLGAEFDELAELLHLVDVPERTGVCLDTCHVWAAGYDLRDQYDEVMRALDDAVGRAHLRLFHLNDSVGALGSHRDRHAHIGTGELGPEPFARLLRDQRFRDVPKVIETPKDGDALRADRRNLRTLRKLRG